MMLRATASRAACLASSRLRCACSTSGRYATTSAFVNHGVLINTLPLRNPLRLMSILSRQRRREQLSQKDDKDNVWETSKVSDPNKLEAAEHEPVPEPAVVGEEKNEWKAVEGMNVRAVLLIVNSESSRTHLSADKLLEEARLKLPLMPMNIPDPEQIRVCLHIGGYGSFIGPLSVTQRCGQKRNASFARVRNHKLTVTLLALVIHSSECYEFE